jgi:hypothetical protein
MELDYVRGTNLHHATTCQLFSLEPVASMAIIEALCSHNIPPPALDYLAKWAYQIAVARTASCIPITSWAPRDLRLTEGGVISTVVRDHRFIVGLGQDTVVLSVMRPSTSCDFHDSLMGHSRFADQLLEPRFETRCTLENAVALVENVCLQNAWCCGHINQLAKDKSVALSPRRNWLKWGWSAVNHSSVLAHAVDLN